MVMTVRSVPGWLLLSFVLLSFFSACSLAEGRENSSPVKSYDRGSNWSVAVETDNRTCDLFFSSDDKDILFSQIHPGGMVKYGIMLRSRSWIPQKEYYDFEFRNEKDIILSTKGRGFDGGDHGTVMIGPLDEKILFVFSKSKILYVKADGASLGRYDLSGAGKGFVRFFDCLKEVKNRKPASSPPPRTRRMN